MSAADPIDDLLEKWGRARPDLNAHPLALVGRVLVLAQQLERRVESALARHDLSLGLFDILATLRREGSLTPKQLLQRVILTSGGMTNRLDKLEGHGWIARKDDPSDRRGVVVELTARGRKVIDSATETRFAEAADSIRGLSDVERRDLEKALRTWLLALENSATDGR